MRSYSVAWLSPVAWRRPSSFARSRPYIIAWPGMAPAVHRVMAVATNCIDGPGRTSSLGRCRRLHRWGPCRRLHSRARRPSSVARSRPYIVTWLGIAPAVHRRMAGSSSPRLPPHSLTLHPSLTPPHRSRHYLPPQPSPPLLSQTLPL